MDIFARLIVFFAVAIAGLLILGFAFKILFLAVILAGITFAGVFAYTAIRRILRGRQGTVTPRPY
jgi:hypothetical protein